MFQPPIFSCNSKFFFQVSLINDDDRSFAALLDRAAIILENIEELSLLKFEIGQKGLGDKENEEAVMIIQEFKRENNNSKCFIPFSFQASTCET